MLYVTPEDMQQLYEPQILIQSTNSGDPMATEVETTVLQSACEHGTGIVDGYLLPLAVAPDKFSVRFLATLRVHAARLAMDHLMGTVDTQTREAAQESITWLESLSKLSSEQIKNLTGNVEGDGTPHPAYAVNYGEGRSWRVTW